MGTLSGEEVADDEEAKAEADDDAAATVTAAVASAFPAAWSGAGVVVTTG
jgi:hypothetical protein